MESNDSQSKKTHAVNVMRNLPCLGMAYGDG